MVFEIEITETLSRRVKMKADNVIDAIIATERLYKRGDIVLDASDYVAVEFVCPAEANGKTCTKRNDIKKNKSIQRGGSYEKAV